MILVVTHGSDLGADLVIRALNTARKPVVRLNTDQLGTPRCHICVADDGPALAVDGGCIPAGEIGAVWHRRVAAPAVLASLRPGYRNFAARELGAMLDAFLESILGLHVNRFDADRLAGNRLLQASRAVAAGLDVPTTLVTQDAERGKAFLAQHPAVDMNGG